MSKESGEYWRLLLSKSGSHSVPLNMRRSKRKAGQGTAAVPTVTISDLPDHITIDILSRLPLNSIFTCKRVCKIWRNLTHEPQFAKLHLSRSPLSLIFYRHGNYGSSSSHFEILQLYDSPVIMKFTPQIFFPYMHLEASCNGSILLSNSSHDLVIVYKPLRAQHFILPEPPKLPLRRHRYSVGFGFGHSPATDQYKVFRFIWYDSARLGCDIYTIGIDDRWRSIGDIGQPPALSASRFIPHFAFLNGALHWIGFENSWFICCFDIEKEQLRRFPFPNQVGNGCDYLGVIDNRLYLCNKQLSELNFWVMKDYGDSGSWTLEWVIEGPITHGFYVSHKPLKMLRDGSLLTISNNYCRRAQVTKTTLASYNPQTRVLKKIKHCGPPGNVPCCALVADVPCFFSPMDALK